MEKLTNYEESIRHKDTKELSDFELQEKIRICNKEISQFDKDVWLLSQHIHDLYAKKVKRKKYVSQLVRDLNDRRKDDKVI